MTLSRSKPVSSQLIIFIKLCFWWLLFCFNRCDTVLQYKSIR